MIKKGFYYSILFGLILLVSACGEDESEGQETNIDEETTEVQTESDENAEDEEDSESGSETTSIQLQHETPEPVENSNFEIVEFEEALDPYSFYWKHVANGTIIFERDNYSLLRDYEDGTTNEIFAHDEEEQNSAYDGKVSISLRAMNGAFDDTYYFNYFNPTETVVYDTDDTALFEVNLETKKMDKVADVGEIYLMKKIDGILYLADEESIYAIDANTKEVVWEVDTVLSSSWYPKLHTTDNSLIFTSLEKIISLSMETGEVLYEEDGYFYGGKGDGETFYALMDDEAMMGDYQLQIVAFDEKDGRQEALTEPLEIDMPYDEFNVNLGLASDHFLIQLENGLVAYDANTFDLVWTVSAGEIADRRETGDDSRYEVFSVIGEQYIYALTEVSGDEDDHRFTVMDASTGEITEHYSLGEGRAAGPYLDEVKENVVVYFYSDEQAWSYILDAE